MNRSENPPTNEFYRIEVQGPLDHTWADWLNGMATQIERQPGTAANTTFTVTVPDQSALRGLLGRLWNLNLTLVSLQKLPSSEVAPIIEKNTTQERSGGDK